MRKLGKFPTYREIEVEKGNDANFPDKGAFYRWGTKEQFATKVAAYCKDKNGYDDIVKLCQSIFEKSSQKDFINNSNINQRLSEVYLFKSGHYYKIGRTNDTVRRGHEIRIQLPEKMDLIHSIKTDDPSGVESYWHKRFESKQMKGEWFDLNASDVKAFKRWRHIC